MEVSVRVDIGGQIDELSDRHSERECVSVLPTFPPRVLITRLCLACHVRQHPAQCARGVSADGLVVPHTAYRSPL